MKSIPNRIVLALGILLALALAPLPAAAAAPTHDEMQAAWRFWLDLTAKRGVYLTQVNPVGGSANPLDYTGTLGAMNGNDTFTLFDVNLTNANHTGSTNFVEIMNVASISGDAQATERAWYCGTGWDYSFYAESPGFLSADLTLDDGVTHSPIITLIDSDDETVTFQKQQGAAGSGFLAVTTAAEDGVNILVGNLKVGDGTPAVPLTGEDAYVEGTLEVDGEARFDGGLNLAGTAVTSTAAELNLLHGVTSLSTGEILLGSTGAIDVGSATAQTIYTVPGGKTAIVTKIVIRGASGTFDQAQDATFSIGWNGTDYNNVVASAAYTYPTASTAYKVLSPVANEATAGTAAQALKVNVTVAATASTTATFDVLGYLF